MSLSERSRRALAVCSAAVVLASTAAAAPKPAAKTEVQGKKSAAAPGKADAPPAAPPKPTMSAEDAADLFNDALEAYYDEEHMHAAAQFYELLERASPTYENYGWAQYFLAECYAQLGMWHAAVVYYYVVAKTRSQPEVLPTTLARLEAISRERPFDEDLIYDKLIYNTDFGTLPPALGSWIAYVQGSFDYQQSFIDWGDRHFGGIDPMSPYRLEGMYVQAVWNVRERRDKEAEAQFRAIIDNPVKGAPSKNLARLSLARLLFERGEFEEAIKAYDGVEQVDLSFEQGQILTEKAWSAYYVKDYARALGFLHALGAPSYEPYFYPDTYLLKALIFKDLCHHLAAKNVVRAFKFKFGRAIEQLKQRIPLERIDRIRRAAMMEGGLARRTHFVQALRTERRLLGNVGSAWERSGLLKHTRDLYDETLEREDRRWRSDFKRSGDRVALRLLDTQEQVRILDYEVSLDIYKPIDAREAALEPEEISSFPERTSNVFYTFDGEYWNDELRDFHYIITSRCLGREK
jgi:hypothetical protein